MPSLFDVSFFVRSNEKVSFKDIRRCLELSGIWLKGHDIPGPCGLVCMCVCVLEEGVGRRGLRYFLAVNMASWMHK